MGTQGSERKNGSTRGEVPIQAILIEPMNRLQFFAAIVFFSQTNEEVSYDIHIIKMAWSLRQLDCIYASEMAAYPSTVNNLSICRLHERDIN